ncbi:MAG: hypothetical protein CMJ32_12420 [Phycisphaerae bacterium]|nr:hypothetical protein [Phycisphaerae bacterium]
MNFRLIRGCAADDVFDHFRSRTTEEGDPFDIENRFKCGLEPGPNTRDGQTLQVAEKTFVQDTADYGNAYHLVLRCAGGWAEAQEVAQRFALIVELKHQPGVRLHARLRERVRL